MFMFMFLAWRFVAYRCKYGIKAQFDEKMMNDSGIRDEPDF